MSTRTQALLGDRWEVLNEIGSGGQGRVVKVRERSTGNLYAAKTINVPSGNDKKLQRAKTEIDCIRKLDGGPGVVRIYDDNLADVLKEGHGTVFFVMDHSKYGSLMDNDFFVGDIEATLKIFRAILVGVKTAHSKGVIHRDLKPANVLFFPTQRDAIVSDFGLGLLLDRLPDDKVTEANEFLGPKYFISPEQFKAPSDVDQRSDIYSLGKILFYMLTQDGRVYREDLPDLSKVFRGTNPYIPLIQETLLSKMVVEDKSKRFANAEEAIDALDRILKQVTENSRRYVERVSNDFDFHQIFVGTRRQEFIDGFDKNVFLKSSVLEWAITGLRKEGSEESATKLYDDLTDKYPRGRVNCAIEAAYLSATDPSSLVRLLERKTTYSFPSYWLALYFYNAKAYENAHQHIEVAIAREKDSEQIMEYLFLLSEIQLYCRCPLVHNAERRIRDILISAGKDRQIEIVKRLGLYYLENGMPEKGLRYLGAYLDAYPFDKEIRFKCGFGYSNLEQYGLSLLHYTSHEGNFDPSGTVKNNIGVIYYQQGLVILATKMYEEALKLGETIAGANLADRFLDIGQKDKALEILRGILKSKEHYHVNVDRALARASDEEMAEEQKNKDLLKAGEVINFHNVRFVRQSMSSSEYNWIGYWEINNSYSIRIEPNPIAVGPFATETSIVGLFDRNCLEITTIVLIPYMTYKNGLAYLLDDNTFMGYALNSSGKIEQLTGSRIHDPEQYATVRAARTNPILALGSLLGGGALPAPPKLL